MNKTVHAFADDALGDLDATALADLVRRGERSSREVVAAAIARAERRDGNRGLRAFQYRCGARSGDDQFHHWSSSRTR